MKFKAILSILLLVSAAQAAVVELLPRLTSKDLNVQTQARLDLLALCSDAGRPGEEEQRRLVCEEICGILKKGGPTVEVMEPLLRNLERIGGEESVPTLAKLLNHKDEHVRDDARRALAVNPSMEATKVLMAQLKNRRTRSVRETAGVIQALGERREPAAVNLIAARFGSRDEAIVIAAIKALGRIGDNPSIRELAGLREKSKGFRRMEIDAALFSSSRVEVFERLYAPNEPTAVRQAALLGLCLNGGLNVASEAIASGNPALQTAVLEAASQKQDPKLYSLVAAALKSFNPALQVQALGVLQLSGIKTYAPEVEAVLKSAKTIELQDAASDALARIGTADSVPLLLANGRPAAKRALGMLNEDGVDAQLEKSAMGAGDAGLRVSAIQALVNRGRKDLIPTFFKLGADSDRAVATAAAEAIGEIGDCSNVSELLDLMIAQEASPVSRNALKALVAILRRTTDVTDAVNLLVERMDKATPRSQANILRVLAQTGKKEALAPLKKACSSSDEQLRKTAIKALGGWSDVNGVPVMLEVATDEATSLADHVVLMRGVSRIWAAQPTWRYRKKHLQPSIDACRRDEERKALKEVQDKLKS